MSVLLTVRIRALRGRGGDLVELLGTASPEDTIDGCFAIYAIAGNLEIMYNVFSGNTLEKCPYPIFLDLG